jgi:hypothetical protein
MQLSHVHTTVDLEQFRVGGDATHTQHWSNQYQVWEGMETQHLERNAQELSAVQPRQHSAAVTAT